MNVNRLVKNLGKTLAGRPTKNKSSRRKNLRRRRKNRRRSGGRTTRAMPAAYATHVRPRFSILSRSNKHCIVSGCDLIYKIPPTIISNGDALFAIITANPAYWKGTRIGRIAPAYQTYRPIYFKVSYIPQVAVTQPGTVFMGTMWDMAPPIDNLQQSLLTSNGGQLTQCYIPADSTVSLGRNLQQNLFKMSGALDTDSNPFLFCVGVAGADVIPGYLYVTYKYELRNPIGDSWTFINSGITNVSSLSEQTSTSNGTIILLNATGSLGPGTILDRESGASTFYYHGSPIDLEGQTQVYYLNNFQTATTTVPVSRMREEVVINRIKYPSSTTNYNFTEFIYGGYSDTNPNANYVVVIRDKSNRVFSVAYCTGSHSFTDTTKYDIWVDSTPHNDSHLDLYSDNTDVISIIRSQDLVFTKLPENYIITGLSNPL